MNREIKFRVWDYGKKIFLPNKTYAILSITEFGAFGIMLTDFEEYEKGEYFYPHSQELNQFTGLKDKNGVDIYEGDLIKYKDFKGISQIRFEKGSFFFYGISVIHFLFNVKESSIEVIGNIYEHKHLLES